MVQPSRNAILFYFIGLCIPHVNEVHLLLVFFNHVNAWIFLVKAINLFMGHLFFFTLANL